MIPSRFKYKLFGRFKGRKKINDSFLNYLNLCKADINNRIIKTNYNILDIGSGSGENAIFLSKTRPTNARIFACDLFQDGNLNLYNQIISQNIKNISLYASNVVEFLDRINDTLIFNEVWILFPDPWPKIRHHKRRLINLLFLNKIYSSLKHSGKLLIASDSSSYVNSIVKTIYDTKNSYFWENQRYELWNYSNLNLPETKFYKKAIRSNRNSIFFKLNKI